MQTRKIYKLLNIEQNTTLQQYCNEIAKSKNIKETIRLWIDQKSSVVEMQPEILLSMLRTPIEELDHDTAFFKNIVETALRSKCVGHIVPEFFMNKTIASLSVEDREAIYKRAFHNSSYVPIVQIFGDKITDEALEYLIDEKNTGEDAPLFLQYVKDSKTIKNKVDEYIHSPKTLYGIAHNRKVNSLHNAETVEKVARALTNMAIASRNASMSLRAAKSEALKGASCEKQLEIHTTYDNRISNAILAFSGDPMIVSAAREMAEKRWFSAEQEHALIDFYLDGRPHSGSVQEVIKVIAKKTKHSDVLDRLYELSKKEQSITNPVLLASNPALSFTLEKEIIQSLLPSKGSFLSTQNRIALNFLMRNGISRGERLYYPIWQTNDPQIQRTMVTSHNVDTGFVLGRVDALNKALKNPEGMDNAQIEDTRTLLLCAGMNVALEYINEKIVSQIMHEAQRAGYTVTPLFEEFMLETSRQEDVVLGDLGKARMYIQDEQTYRMFDSLYEKLHNQCLVNYWMRELGLRYTYNHTENKASDIYADRIIESDMNEITKRIGYMNPECLIRFKTTLTSALSTPEDAKRTVVGAFRALENSLFAHSNARKIAKVYETIENEICKKNEEIANQAIMSKDNKDEPNSGEIDF